MVGQEPNPASAAPSPARLPVAIAYGIGVLVAGTGLWIARGALRLECPLPGVLGLVEGVIPEVRGIVAGGALTLAGSLAAVLAVGKLAASSPSDFQLPAPGRPDRWSSLALLVAASCGGLLCQRLAAGPFTPAHLWLLAGGVGFGGFAFHHMDRQDPRRTGLGAPDVLIALALAALSAIVSSVRITHWNFTAVGDEGEFFTLARDIAEGRYAWSPFNLAGVYGDHPVLDSLLQAAVMKWLGATAFGWRMAEVLVLAASTALEYTLARLLLRPAPAMIAALVVGTSHYLMAFARIAYNNNHCVLYGLLAMTSLVLAWRTQRVLFVFAAGCAMGLCLYTIATALLIWPVVAVLWLWEFVRAPGRRPIGSGLVLLAGFVLVVTPALSATGVAQVGKLLVRHGPQHVPWQPSPPVTSAISLGEALTVFWVNNRWFHHYVAGPLVDPVIGLALAVGIVHALLRISRTAERIAIIWFLGGHLLVAFTAYSPQPFFTRLMFLMPAAGLLAGAAAAGLEAILAKGLGRPRWMAAFVVAAVVALPATNLRQLLVIGPRRLVTNPETLTRKVLAEHPGSLVIEVAGAPNEVRELFLSQYPTEYARYRFSRIDSIPTAEGAPAAAPTLFLVHDVSLVEPLKARLGSRYACSEEWDPAHAVHAWLFQPASGRPASARRSPQIRGSWP